MGSRVYNSNSNNYRDIQSSKDFVKNVENFKPVSVYHKAIIPIIYLLRVFGIYPYRLDGEIYFQYKSFIFVYSLVLYSLQLTITGKTISNSYRYYRLKQYDLIQIYIVVCLSFIPVCTSPLIWISCKKLENFFAQWTVFQSRYNLIMHSPLKSNREKWLILKHAFAFVTSYCIFFWLLDIVDMQWFHATFCIMCILFHSLFMTLCVLTELTFQLIMDHYKKQLIIGINGKFIGVRVMEEYRLIWVSISQLVQKFGACFSLMLTLHLLLHSILFVLLVYNFVGLASHYIRLKDYYKFFKLFAAPWIPFVMTYVCCNTGHLITKHCTENISELIVEMKSKLLTFRSDNTISIKLFLYAVNDFKPTVNILGYFEINRPLFGSIISILVTYMIVLVQFETPFAIAQIALLGPSWHFAMYDDIGKPVKTVRFKSHTCKPAHYAYQDFILPVLKIERALGFAPFCIDRGEITSNFNWSTTLYALSVYIVVIMLTLLTQYHIMTEIKTRDVKFNKALVQYLKLLSITQQLLGPLPFLLQKRNFQRFFKKWILFQDEYEKLTSNVLRLDDAKTLRNIGMLFVPAAAIIPFLLRAPPFDTSIPSIIHDVTFSIFFVHQVCIILYWLLTSKAIQLISNQYHCNFIKEVRNGLGYTSIVEAYRLLWMILCNITNKFAPSIGATITVCLVFHVLYLIVAAYRIVSSVPDHLRNGQPWSILPIVLDLIFHLGLILFFCNVGQNVGKYCTNNMLNTILDIKEQSQFRTLDGAKINIFLYTINEYAPLVNVCGFYEINRSLFGGVVSVLLTYMIVIIQLKDSI